MVRSLLEVAEFVQARLIGDATVRNVIYVPGRLVNIVVRNA